MGGLPKVREKLVDAVAGAAVSFDLAVPAALGGVESESLLDFASGPQTWCVLGRGTEPEPEPESRQRLFSSSGGARVRPWPLFTRTGGAPKVGLNCSNRVGR